MTGINPWKCALQVMLVIAMSAAAAFGVGKLFEAKM